MASPQFSVVIPAYNQAKFLTTTVKSILNQTLDDFEIIIVNDASTDDTTEVVRNIENPRIQLIVHDVNKGLPATRNTGMRAANGKYIALLDADDLFHPQKLEVHAKFLEEHLDVDISYNSRFELNYSDTTIRNLVRPPLTVGLVDFIHGYPFTPSDMVIRKGILDTLGGFDERYIAGGEDMEYPSTLALAGCKFASVDRALNYRRHHSNRHRKNLDERLNDVQQALKQIYSDPRCPQEIRTLGKTPLTEHYMVLVYLALIQNRSEDGQRFLSELIQFNPNVIKGFPCPLVEYFAKNSTADEKDNHKEILENLFNQLPELSIDYSELLYWSIQHGYLIKGVRAALWGRPEAAKRHFKNAANNGAEFSDKYLQTVIQDIINFEVEMGNDALKVATKQLLPSVQQLTKPFVFRRFLGELAARMAFENYNRQQFNQVPGNIFRAIRYEPRYVSNPGLFSIFIRSIFHL